MKKLLLTSFIVGALIGCTKHDDILPTPKATVTPELTMMTASGIKLQTPFVTSEVAMNIKVENAGAVTVKIYDISNRVVSKETLNATSGDNILKVYTTALPSSAYRVAIYDELGKLLGIADFNKL